MLGRLVNSITQIVSVPQDKLDRIVALTKEALKRGSFTLKEATSLAGLLVFCAPAVQLGFVFCRRLWTFIATFQSRWVVQLAVVSLPSAGRPLVVEQLIPYF